MVRRKIERFEIVVIGLDHRSFSDGISQILEYADDFILRANDRVLGANGVANAGKGNVDCGFCCLCWRGIERGFDLLLDFSFQLVDALTDFAFRLFRSSFQPEFVNLRENTVFACKPSIAESLAVIGVFEGGKFLFQSREQFLDCAVERLRGEIFQFGNGVGHALESAPLEPRGEQQVPRLRWTIRFANNPASLGMTEYKGSRGTAEAVPWYTTPRVPFC